MLMRPDGFLRQDRGSSRFDRWQWPERAPTLLGDLLVELTTRDGERPPDDAMAQSATELVEFAVANGDLLLDLIYGHYRCAEENDWLSFWDVRPGLGRDHVLSQVRSVELAVRRDRKGKCNACVSVAPRWDLEHGLSLDYESGRIVTVNDSSYILVGDVLWPA